MQIKSIMTQQVVTLTRDNTVRDAINIMKEKDIGSVIVVDEDFMVIDILTEGDILKLIDKDFKINAALRISELPKKEHLFSILETESIENAIKILYEVPIHHLVVTDYSGILKGIISTKDIIKAEKRLQKTFPYFPNSQLIH